MKVGDLVDVEDGDQRYTFVIERIFYDTHGRPSAIVGQDGYCGKWVTVDLTKADITMKRIH